MTRLGAAGAARLHRHHRGLQRLPRRRRALPARAVGARCRRALARLERTTGKRFGDPANPLLVSCRSGAKFSMPGMMDTVLNIGLNDDVVEGLARLTGDARFAFDSYRRLVQMFGSRGARARRRAVRGRARPERAQRAGVDERRRAAAPKTGGGSPASSSAIVRARDRARLPARSGRAAPARHRGGVPELERQARRRLPQRRAHPARPRHGGEHLHHGVRQPRATTRPPAWR